MNAFDPALSYFPVIELALGKERLGWVKDKESWPSIFASQPQLHIYFLSTLLTLLLQRVTKTEFLLTVSIQCQEDKY